MATNKIIRFCVFGCGHIGKRHATVVENNPECELVALCDTKEKGLLNLESFKAPFFSSLSEMLSSGIEFDVASIATPNGMHEEHSIEAIRSGHHVLIEKPMALSKAGCERIIFEALNNRKLVFCVMQNRYSPPAKWLKELLTNDTLGKIFMVQINCFWNRDARYYTGDSWHGTKELDGGTLFTQFSHFIDILYWLFGDITNIRARLRDFNHLGLTDFEDSGTVTFDFVNGGGLGSINYSSSVWDKNLGSSITIIAEKGSVKVGGQYMNDVEQCHIKDYQLPELAASNPPNDYGIYKGSAANHHYVYENVVDVLKGRASIKTNALEGLKVVEIIEKIYNSNT